MTRWEKLMTCVYSEDRCSIEGLYLTLSMPCQVPVLYPADSRALETQTFALFYLTGQKAGLQKPANVSRKTQQS